MEASDIVEGMLLLVEDPTLIGTVMRVTPQRGIDFQRYKDGIFPVPDLPAPPAKL